MSLPVATHVASTMQQRLAWPWKYREDGVILFVCPECRESQTSVNAITWHTTFVLVRVERGDLCGSTLGLEKNLEKMNYSRWSIQGYTPFFRVGS